MKTKIQLPNSLVPNLKTLPRRCPGSATATPGGVAHRQLNPDQPQPRMRLLAKFLLRLVVAGFVAGSLVRNLLTACVCYILMTMSAFAQSGPPIITQDLTNVTVLQGQNAVFSIAAANGPLACQWQSEVAGSGDFVNLTDGLQANGLQISGSTTPTLTVSGATPGNDSEFRVVVANPLGTATSSTATLTVLAAASATYSVNLQPGLNLIANQLDHGSNTLNEIMPVVPDGSVIYKYDNSSGVWEVSGYNAAAGIWIPGTTALNPNPGSLFHSPTNFTLAPGEGAFFQAPTNFTLAFTGTPNVPVLPVTIPAGTFYLVSRQTNDVGNYTNIVGTPPAKKAQILQWNPGSGSFKVSTFAGSGWTSGGTVGPTAAVGEALWISASGGGTVPTLPQSVLYQGLLNTALGNATLSVSGNSLTLGNLGDTGQDGVQVLLNPGSSFAGDWGGLDPNDSLPVGAFVASQLIGNAAGITNGVLGTTTCTKAGTSNYVVTVDYSPLGSSTHTVQVYNGSTLVAQVTGQSGTQCATLKLPPWICTINPYLNNEWPTGTEISINGGPTVTGTELLMIPEGGAAIGSATGVQILAGNIPSLTLTSENSSLVFQGLTNTSLGNASLAVSGGQLAVGNLGVTGLDGFSVALPASLAHFVLSCPPSSGTNPPSLGAWFQAQEVGTANGITNGLLSTLTVTPASGGNYQISASYAPLGVSTVTVQAFYNGVLTAQTTGQAGPVIASCTASPDTFDLGGIEAGSVDFHNLTNLVTLAAGLAAVPCDHLIISPENAPPGIVPTAFQVVASGVPAFTIASETATVVAPVGSNPLVFQGLTNWGVGNATLAVSGGALYVTNLGSSGQDGVSFAWPANATALVVDLSSLDPSGTLPIGSYLQDSAVGFGNDVTDGSLGYLNFTKITQNTIAMSANFSAIGVSSCVVQAYQSGVLVAQVTNTGPAGGVLLDLPGWPGALDYDVPEVVPPHWTAELNPNTVVQFPGGPAVMCDQIAVTPENFIAQGPPLAFQLTASQIPSLNITGFNQPNQSTGNVGLVYQGLTNTSLGHATLAVSGSQLYVTNLGSSGQDGVTISVPTNLTVLEVKYQPLDVSNSLPVGAWLQEQIIGTTADISNGVLGTVTVTKQCGDCGGSNYVLSADYASIGATTFTVQASLNGLLVGQATHQSGTALAELPDWPDSSDMDPVKTDTETVDIGPNPLPVWLGGATAAVVCDHLYIIPENVTNATTLTAFAITASQIPVINITSENASLVFQGLTNTSLGHASLTIANNTLTVGDLGLNGQDGVQVSLNPDSSLAVGLEDLDPSNSLPVGAFVASQLIGNAAGITNGVLGTTTCTKAGTSNYVVTVDYSPLGASSHTVQVYNGSTLVAQVTGQSGTLCATLQIPPRILTYNPLLNDDWPTGTVISINGGPTVTGTELLMIPEGGAAIGSASAVQILAGGIPSFNITNEVETLGENPSLVYQGITNRGLGNATLVYWPAVSTNELVLSNLGDSGQDGVAIPLPALPGGVLVNWLPLDVSNALPVNAYIQEQAIGTANGVVDGPLGTVTVTKTGATNYVVSADFSPLGAATFTVQAFLNGVLVAQLTGQDKAALTSVGLIPFPDISYQPYPPPPTLKISQHLATAQTTLLAGQVVTWDTLYLTPNVTLNGAPTALAITASQVPTITITSENESVLYKGLSATLLGNAALAETGGYFVITNLGSSGQDGAAFSVPTNLTAFAAGWQDLDDSNSLPVGAYLQAQAVGLASGITNGPLGTLYVRKAGKDNFVATVDFSPLQATKYTVLAFSNGVVVAQITNQVGVSVGVSAAEATAFGLVAAGSPPQPEFQVNWPPGTEFILTGGPTVACDGLLIRPQNAPIAGTPTGLNLTASQVPALTVTGLNVLPASVSINHTGQNITLQWLGTAGLQESSDLSHWSTVTGASSPYAIQVIGGIHVYSLVPATPPIFQPHN